MGAKGNAYRDLERKPEDATRNMGIKVRAKLSLCFIK
jgi:hypothetical protein